MKYLYRRSTTPTLPNRMVWFALTSDYGSEESYGSIASKYKIKTPLTLLNLGLMKNRIAIVNKAKGYSQELGLSHRDIENMMDPDQQYSGKVGNVAAHQLIEVLYGDRYDGTIIISSDDQDIDSRYKTVDDEDLEGATEVVIFNNVRGYLERG